MSIIGEVLHEAAAFDLAKVLIAAHEDPRWGDCRSCVKGFAKETLYPLYLLHMGDVYSTPDWDIKVKEIYENS